jgi:spore coat polysaccharide biosynthesis predicted glycosyltransferase SpsG
MRAVFRADGGSRIGYGHLVRSGAVAHELHRQGHAITLATTTPQSARTFFPDDSTIFNLPSRGDPQPFVDRIDSTEPDFVFTDAYPVDTAYQRVVRNRVRLAVVQDDTRHAVCADLFINGNLYGPDLDYEYIREPPEECLGTDYALLRREIRKRTVDEPPWREKPERAIIMMGGSDLADLTPTAIQAFDSHDLRVDAIVGPGCTAGQEQAVYKAAQACSADIRVARNPENLADRMVQADFGVSTASSTTYELLALATPIVSIPVVDNQEPIAAALRKRDAATALDRTDGQQALRSAIAEYMTDTERRYERRQRGRELVDGEGVERTTAHISDIVARD